MTIVEVKVEGLDALAQALAHFPAEVQPELERAAQAALLSLIPDLADYPRPPAGSEYRRTGTLGRLWTAARPEFETIASGFKASIGNATPYGQWVQSEATQARVHRGRWPTAEQVVRDHEQQINAYFEAALQRVADKLSS